MQPSLELERKKLIALELRAHGICTRNGDPFGLFNSLVDACYRVMLANPHENHLGSTGVAIFSHKFNQYDFEEGRDGRFIRVDPLEENTCWALADGISSFVAKDPDGIGLLTLRSPALDELSLFTFRDDILFDDEVGPTDPPRRECLVVQRSEGHSNRRMTILARENIVTFSGLSYVSKPYQYDILRSLRERIVPFPWGDDCIQTLKSALRLAVHKLSPENRGGTLVIFSPDDFSALDRIIAAQQLMIEQAIQPSTCSLTQRANQRPLVHLMGQVDGATTISPTGDVLHVGAFFPSVGPEMTKPATTHHYGTRHRSAAEFSKGIEGIAIVISSDGPVTVFRKGQTLPIPTIGS